MSVGVYSMRHVLGWASPPSHAASSASSPATSKWPAPLPPLNWKRSEVVGLSVELPGPLRPSTAPTWQYSRKAANATASYDASIADFEIGVSHLRLPDRDVDIDNALGDSLEFMTEKLESFRVSRHVSSITRDACAGRDVTLTRPAYVNPILMRYLLLVRDEDAWTVVVSGHPDQTAAVADRILASVRVLSQP
jgi:hypothetical protein